jgi:iron complex outermembrane receptor protein
MLTLRVYSNFSTVQTDVLHIVKMDFYNALRVVQAQDVVKLGAAHSIRIAAEYRNSVVNTSPIGGGHIEYNIASISGTWNWHALPWLTLTGAARLDRLWLNRSGAIPFGLPLTNDPWRRDLTVPTFNVGAVIKPGDDDTLRVTAAQGAVLPSLLDFGALQMVFGPFAYGGQPSIQPTKVTNAEIDWDHDLDWLGISLRAAAFYQTTHGIQAMIGPANINFAGLQLGLAQNIGNSREIGAEFSVKGVLPRNFHWNVGYSPRLVHDNFSMPHEPMQAGFDFQRGTPRQTGTIGLDWAAGRWEIDGFAHAQSGSNGVVMSLPGLFQYRPLPAYVSFDGRIACQVAPGITLSLTGQNIGVRTQPQSVYSRVDRRIAANLVVTF